MNRLFAAFDAAATNILDPSTLFVCGSSSGTTNAVIDDLDWDEKDATAAAGNAARYYYANGESYCTYGDGDDDDDPNCGGGCGDRDRDDGICVAKSTTTTPILHLQHLDSNSNINEEKREDQHQQQQHQQQQDNTKIQNINTDNTGMGMMGRWACGAIGGGGGGGGDDDLVGEENNTISNKFASKLKSWGEAADAVLPRVMESDDDKTDDDTYNTFSTVDFDADDGDTFDGGTSNGTLDATLNTIDFYASFDGTYATYDNADEDTFDGMYATCDNDDGENSTNQGQSLANSDSDNCNGIVIRDFVEEDHMNGYGLRLIKAGTMRSATVTSATTTTTSASASTSTSWSRTTGTGTISEDTMHDSLGEHYRNKRKNKNEDTIGYYCYDDDDSNNNSSNDHNNLMPALKRELSSFGKSREFRSFDRTTNNNNTVQENCLRPSFVMTNNNSDDIDQKPQLVSLDEENKHYEYLTIYTSSSSTSTEIDTIDSTPTSPSSSLHAHETTLSNHNRQIQQQQSPVVATAMISSQNNNNDNKTTPKGGAVVQQSSFTHNRPSFKRAFKKLPPFLSFKKSYEHIDE
jgi:hypothetical protein